MTIRYGQFCPVSKAAEVLWERCTILIIRDLLLGTTCFNRLAFIPRPLNWQATKLPYSLGAALFSCSAYSFFARLAKNETLLRCSYKTKFGVAAIS